MLITACITISMGAYMIYYMKKSYLKKMRIQIILICAHECATFIQACNWINNFCFLFTGTGFNYFVVFFRTWLSVCTLMLILFEMTAAYGLTARQIKIWQNLYKESSDLAAIESRMNKKAKYQDRNLNFGRAAVLFVCTWRAVLYTMYAPRYTPAVVSLYEIANAFIGIFVLVCTGLLMYALSIIKSIGKPGDRPVYLYLQVIMIIGIFIVILCTFFIKLHLIYVTIEKAGSNDDPLKFLNASYSALMLTQQLVITFFLWIGLFTIKKFADEAKKDSEEKEIKALKKQKLQDSTQERLIEDCENQEQ